MEVRGACKGFRQRELELEEWEADHLKESGWYPYGRTSPRQFLPRLNIIPELVRKLLGYRDYIRLQPNKVSTPDSLLVRIRFGRRSES